MHRRQFLQTSVLSGLVGSSFAGLGLTGGQGHSLLARSFAAASTKPLRVGLIGCGWYGKVDLLRLLQVAPVDVVSLCDVDRDMLSGTVQLLSERHPQANPPQLFEHYEELLQQTQPEVVLIATPDHWHALPAIAAIQSGADVYLQKPVGVDVVEGQAILAAARKHQRVVQVGTQRRSTPHLVEAKRTILDEGRLGKIGLVEIYCYYHMRTRENPADGTPPANLNYDLWTGPAPLRPYNKLVHPRGWRAFMEYGNGIVGDMCIHMLDMVRWMLDLGWPDTISSQGGILVDPGSKANITDTQSATFQFGALPVNWTHRTWGSTPDPAYPWGATIYGEHGTLKCSVHSYDFIPNQGERIHRDVQYELDSFPADKTERDLEQHVAPAVRAHMKDLLAARESRGRPVADIEQGHISTASCVLANIALELGRSLRWDSTTQQVIGDAEANSRLARPYRAPWQHPHPDHV